MLTHEMAVLKRWKFRRSREGLNADQLSLLGETNDVLQRLPTQRMTAIGVLPPHRWTPQVVQSDPRGETL